MDSAATVAFILCFWGAFSAADPHWMSSPLWRRLLDDSNPTTEIVVIGDMDDADGDHCVSEISGPPSVYYHCTDELKTSSLLDDNAKVIIKDLKILGTLSEKDKEFIKGFMRKHEVYVKVEGNEATVLHRVLGDLPLVLDSKVFVVAAKQATVMEFFRYAEDKELVAQEVPCQGDSCSPMKDIWMRRNNMTGITLKTTYAIWTPFSIQGEKEGELPGGMDPELFLQLQKMLGFDIEAIPSVDGSWGGLQSDNVTFSGMVGMFQRGEVDVSMVSFSFNEDRAKVMDFSSTTYTVNLKIVAKPNVGNYDFFDLFAVFRQETVYCLATMCLLNVFAQSIVFVVDMDRSFFLLGNVLHGSAVVFKSVILMGHSRTSKFMSGKVLLMSILATGIVSFSYYKGGILSKLATSEESVPVETLEDILVEAETRDMTFGTVRSSFYQQFFEHAPHNTPMWKVWDKVMKPNYEEAMVSSVDDGIRKVQEEDNYALFASVIRTRTEPDYPCALREVGHTLTKVPNALCFRKGSPYKALVDYSLNRLHENGLSRRVKEKYFGRFAVPNCQRFTGSGLGFKSIFGVFFVLFAGLGLCLAWLVIEACCGNVAGLLRGRRGGVPLMVRRLHHLCDVAMEDVSAVTTRMSPAEEEWFLRRLRSRLLERIEDPGGRKYIQFTK